MVHSFRPDMEELRTAEIKEAWVDYPICVLNPRCLQAMGFLLDY